jgi:glutamine synthetase
MREGRDMAAKPQKSTDAKEKVYRQIKEQNVKFIRMWFTDILGFLKSFSVRVEELDRAFEEGLGFDGSSVEGFVRIDESDMIARPDPSTYSIIPWRPMDHATAKMFCDIHWPDGRPFEGDPRYVLKQNLRKAAEKGFTCNVGPELEYFYFKSEEEVIPLDRGGYFDVTPPNIASEFRRQTIITLEQMGISVEYAHHEVAPSQHEIDLRYTDALTMADQVMTYRIAVKEVAQRHGVYATFMPKPVARINGSGMHVHISLFKGDRNAFFDKDDVYHLSKTAKCFLAGLLKHIPEITVVNNQWINSYKRLIPGYEAPVYITWARRNRSDLIRIPEYQPGREKATRMELRSPDPACNPYLCFSVILAAGLKGIEKGYPLPEPSEENVYEMKPEERAKKGIKTLPGSLAEAIEIAEGSKLLKEALGDHVFDSFIKNKKIEWDLYRTAVTDFELKRYLPLL